MPAPRALPRCRWFQLGLAACLTLTASAQELAAGRASAGRLTAAATTDCAGGLVNDNGTFEDGMFFFAVGGGALPVDAVMRFAGPGAGHRIDQVCVCWIREPGASTSLDHELLIFSAAGGEPANVVAAFDVTANGIGTSPTMFPFDLAPFDVLTPGTNFFVGVSWVGGTQTNPAHFLCADTDNPTVSPSFVAAAGTDDWVDVRDFAELADVDALGIRTELAGSGPLTCPATPCVEDEFGMCLNGGRFRVTAEFDRPDTPSELTEAARAVRLTGDSGLLWFFQDTNIEAIVKVLDACGVNDRYWVFAGGLTNVETIITVCDTAAGIRKDFTNPQGAAFQPIQDTDAFATCP
jgi:hypothetical protein